MATVIHPWRLRNLAWLVPPLSLIVAGLFISCGDSPTEPSPAPPRPPESRPTSVSISPAADTLIALDDTVRLTAEAWDQNQRPVTGTAVTWTSSDEAIVAVDASGLARAVANGEATITASAGPTASGTAAITVRQVAGTVSVTPVADTLVAGDTLRLAAEALDANGHIVAEAVFSWSSSDPMVATVDSTGLVIAKSAGEAAIGAASADASGRMALRVIAAAPTLISVSPDSVRLEALGDTAQLVARVRDQRGRAIEGAEVAWSSDDHAVATADSAGLVTAVGGGTTRVKASLGGLSEEAAVAVMQVVDSVVVSPAADTLVAGDTLQLAAEALDANGHTVAGAEFVWSSSDSALATVDSTGLVTAASTGEAGITAMSGGVTGRMELVISAPVPTSISVVPDEVEMEALGDTVRLAAEVLDQRGRVLERASVSWSSGNESVVGVDPSGLLTAIGAGRAAVTAASGTASASVPVSVLRIAASVVVSPPTSGISPGAILRLTAKAFDWNGHAISGAEFAWSSSDPSVATVDAVGLVQGASSGITTITARSGRAKGSSQVAVGNSDRAALVAFYQATDGEHWSRGDNWLTSAPVAEWYGIRVDDGGRVSHLELPDNNVAGRIPGELVHLTSLQALDLSSNGLAGPIPPEVGDLRRLELLRLGGNYLTGSIPRKLGNLANLQRVNFNNNRLSGPIPRDLGKLKGLESLQLISNQLTGSIPPELGNLADLRILMLGYNQLTGSIPREFGNLTNLSRLYLLDNELTGSIPPELGRLPELERLHLDSNELTGSIPPELGDLPDLRRLGLGSNQLTGSIPRQLGGLTNLTELHLHGNRLTGSIPPELGDLTNLSRLYLQDNELAGRIPAELGNLVKLHRFWISRNRLTGPLPRSLVALTELEQLVFEGNNGVCVPGTSTFVAWLRDIDPVGGSLCNTTDQAALIELFEATGGDSWARSDGWLGDDALSEWYGVVGDSLGHVVTLDLSGNGLVGRLPSSLAQLTRLTILRISGNEVSGRLPVGLAQLPLQEFRYSDTGLCAPSESSFQEWLASLSKPEAAGEVCGTPSDRDILTALYEATGGPRWKNSDHWLTDAPIGDWYGVAVDEEGRVDRLDLPGNDLTGTIPPELGDLLALRVLDFRVNRLTGSIPPELGNLANLSSLRVLGNRLRGKIPPELGNLKRLNTLWLGFNDLSGPIPLELGSLENLRDLSLGGNRLSGRIPSELGNLSSLDRLRLLLNGLTGPIPPRLGNLQNLTQLDLRGNQFTGPIPPELGRLRNLRELNVAGNQFTGPIPPELGRLRNLRELNVAGNPLSGSIPPDLGNLTSLRGLSLAESGLTGRIPPELGNLGSLESLDLRDNQLTGSIPPELGGLIQLVDLQLSDNPGLSGPLPSSLVALARLQTLFVTGTDLCAPSDNSFRAWMDGVANQYVPFCLDGVGRGTAYLTQATQSRTSRVPLIAGERALLRAFVTAGQATSLTIPRVRTTFYLNGSEAHIAEIPSRTTIIPTGVDEGDLSASANVEIPGEIIQPGLEMVVEIDPEGTLPARLGVAQRIPETDRLDVDVRAMPELDLTLIPFVWSQAPDSTILGTVEAMAADPEGHELLFDTHTLLPVGDLRVTAHEPVLSSSNDAEALLRETRAIRVMEGATSHYMGMLPDDDRKGVVGIAFRPGRSSFSLARSSIIAHELGHNMSLEHAPCNVFGPLEYPHRRGSIGVWGFDFRGGGRLVRPGTPDLMSYCNPQWISDYHFSRALHFRLRDEGSGASTADARPVQSLLLWGGVDADAAPFLEPAFVVDAATVLPEPGRGGYEVTGRTLDGRTLFSLRFDMPEIPDGAGRSSFVFSLPVETSWARELAAITLTGPGGTVTLDGDTDRPMVILRDGRSGQVRGFLRDPPLAALAGGRVDVRALSPDQGLEALFSRGLPGPREWRR